MDALHLIPKGKRFAVCASFQSGASPCRIAEKTHLPVEQVVALLMESKLIDGELKRDCINTGCIYRIGLSDDCKYIGWTDDVYRLVGQYIRETTMPNQDIILPSWMLAHKLVAFECFQHGCTKQDADTATLEAMIRFGTDRVRGGRWQNVDQNPPTLELAAWCENPCHFFEGE